MGNGQLDEIKEALALPPAELLQKITSLGWLTDKSFPFKSMTCVAEDVQARGWLPPLIL